MASKTVSTRTTEGKGAFITSRFVQTRIVEGSPKPAPGRGESSLAPVIPLPGGGRLQNDIVYLTPDLFRRLDDQARTQAGKPICVYDHAENPGQFAFVDFMCCGVFHVRESVQRVAKEMTMVFLANRISLQEFRATARPEMDWNAVPPELIYPFVIQHEIAHCRNYDAAVMFDLSLGRTPYILSNEDFRRFRVACEMRADREAWEALCPGQPMPMKPRAQWPPEELEKTLEKAAPLAQRYAPGAVKPISTDPDMFVPYSHVREGIPWIFPLEETEQGRLPFGARFAMAAVGGAA